MNKPANPELIDNDNPEWTDDSRFALMDCQNH